ncbi:MAG: TonB-dependent receptor, partial [Desulfomonilia bacterium]
PVSGDLIDLSIYNVAEIDRIEVVKGSNSAAFGGSAMGGAINIVTRNPGPEKSLEFTSSFGTYGREFYGMHLNAPGKEVGFLLNAAHTRADNDFLYEREDGSTVRRKNNDVRNTTLLGKLWMDMNGWDTLVTGTLAEQELGSPGSEGDAGWLTPDDEVKVRQYSLMIDLSRELDNDASLSIKAARTYSRNHSTTSYAGDTFSRLTGDFLDLVYSRGMGPLSLSPELVLRRERLSSDEYGIHSRTVTSGVLNSSLDLDPFLLSLTLRRDYSTAFEGRWTWHGGARWSATPHLGIRANAGTGYRDPTMGHLYSPSSWYTFVSNPDLKPEKSFGWDVGPVVEYERFGFSACYFVTRYSDLIKMDYPEAMTFTYINVDRAHASGVEANAWVLPADGLKVTLGYALNRFRYVSGPYESKTMKLKPRSIFTLSANYLLVLFGRELDLFASYQFREGMYTDDANTRKTGNRNLVDAGVALGITRHASAAFKVSNLLDDTSVEFEDSSEWGTFWYPVPGRTYRASVQVRF